MPLACYAEDPTCVHVHSSKNHLAEMCSLYVAGIPASTISMSCVYVCARTLNLVVLGLRFASVNLLTVESPVAMY